MNQKQPFKTDYRPEFLHEIQIPRGEKTYTLTQGMEVSVTGRTNLPAGRYEFVWGELQRTGVMLIYVEGPVRRRTRRMRCIRISDIKQVHVATRSGRDDGQI